VNATATSPVPATETGIVCGKCSSFSVKIRHASVAAVRLCAQSTDNRSALGVTLDSRLATPPVRPTTETPARLAPRAPGVPAGHYAIDWNGTLGFFQVDRPTEGRWAGYTFVKQQASDETYPVRNRQQREAILAKISEDGTEEAMLRYGKEIGRCGHCNRTLTNEESRQRGIGPICANKMGF
jgi:hypothetical protein